MRVLSDVMTSRTSDPCHLLSLGKLAAQFEGHPLQIVQPAFPEALIRDGRGGGGVRGSHYLAMVEEM